MMQMPKCSKFLRCFFVSLHLPYFWFIEFQSPLCIFASDMKFVQNFTPPDFQAKNFTPSISPNLNSFSKKKHKKWVKMKKFTVLHKNFILPLAVTAVTNLTSANHYISYRIHILYIVVFLCLIALSHFMFSSSSCLCTTHMIKIFHTVFFISQF